MDAILSLLSWHRSISSSTSSHWIAGSCISARLTRPSIQCSILSASDSSLPENWLFMQHLRNRVRHLLLLNATTCSSARSQMSLFTVAAGSSDATSASRNGIPFQQKIGELPICKLLQRSTLCRSSSSIGCGHTSLMTKKVWEMSHYAMGQDDSEAERQMRESEIRKWKSDHEVDYVCKEDCWWDKRWNEGRRRSKKVYERFLEAQCLSHCLTGGRLLMNQGS